MRLQATLLLLIASVALSMPPSGSAADAPAKGITVKILGGSTTPAQPANDEITANVGQLVELNASAIQATSHAWMLANATEEFRTYDKDTVLVFATAKEGIYIFVLAVAAQDSKVQLYRKSVRVVRDGGAGPGPDRGPEPSNTCEKVPERKYGLGKKACLWASEVKSPNVRDEAKALAKDLIGRVRFNITGQAWDIAKIKQEIRNVNGPAWDGWFQKLGTEIQRLESTGALVQPRDYEDVLFELAEGLKG